MVESGGRDAILSQVFFTMAPKCCTSVAVVTGANYWDQVNIWDSCLLEECDHWKQTVGGLWELPGTVAPLIRWPASARFQVGPDTISSSCFQRSSSIPIIIMLRYVKLIRASTWNDFQTFDPAANLLSNRSDTHPQFAHFLPQSVSLSTVIIQ